MDISSYRLNALSTGNFYIPPIQRNENSSAFGEDLRQNEQALQDEKQEEAEKDTGADLLNFLSIMHPVHTLNISRQD